ncbi:HesA/MoeB/ThiF family protein [Aureibaculum sp. 2210JD6-5]|uniref:HesA/MoeB/ThiF family protein n=1 Tax=Aureibaculum sp. 2210JD6-5 TaxID=3103957 RepID=UPI002AAEE6A1|nr:HesA/MoeB/ThiF family protein [Aureibaculum sp. 2210JD6-5]MDY7396212.1 HesA/MoeB/ThiF family protein [Aureibaculum sp. 2210JD6-5]
MNIIPKQLFTRQTTLSEIGEEGQQKLQQTSVLIVGCGGLGNTVATSLAGSGIGTIHLLDFDTVDISNLHRQLFFTLEDVGKPKVEVLGNYLRKIAPFTDVFEHKLTVNKKNIFELISKADYILDCTDSLPTKYLLNDACVLKNKPLIYGSLYKFDGYVSSFNIRQKDGEFSTNLRDTFPEMSKEAIPNCSEIGTLNTIVGIIGLLQANEVLKLVCGIGKPLVDELLIYNSLENSQYKIKLKMTDSSHSERMQRISQIFDKESYVDLSCEVQNDNLLISAKTLRKKLSHGEASLGLTIISVIEDIDTKMPFHVHKKIPLSQLKLEDIDFNKENEYVVVCNRGVSSYIATQKIKEKFPDLEVLSLKGGISNY